MPETSSSEGGSRRPGRNRNNRGPRNNNNRGDYRVEPANRANRPDRTTPKPSVWQKFLGLIGLGKAKAKPARPVNPARAGNGDARPQRSSGGSGDTYVAQGSRSIEGRNRQPRENREPREPRAASSPADVTTERLYVGNLSYDATESDLVELFRGVGGVRNAEVVVNNRTERSKGFAFVTMNSVEEAKRAVSELSNKDFMGRPLQVSGAKPPSQDRGERRRDEQEEEEVSAA